MPPFVEVGIDEGMALYSPRVIRFEGGQGKLLRRVECLSFGEVPMSKINFSQTQVRVPDSIKWTGQEGFPQNSLENARPAASMEKESISPL
jgi:hypothetical protein